MKFWGKNMQNAWHMLHNKQQKEIAKGYLSDSGDLKMHLRH